MQATSPTNTTTMSRRWMIMIWLCVGYMVAYFDRVNLSVALAQKDFQQFFDLTAESRGWLNSGFFITYALLQIPAGWFVDRYGVKWPWVWSFTFWSLLSAATAFVGGFWQLFAIRLMLGVGEACITPAGMRWIRYNFAENQRGLMIGLFMGAAKLGPAIGTYIAAHLLANFGWQNMFIILGLGCLIWIGPWIVLVKDNDRELEAATKKAAVPGSTVPFGKLLASPVIIGTLIGTFCYQYFTYFSMTWLPSYFAERRGLDLKATGSYTAFSLLGMAIVATLAGFAADRLIDRGWNPVRVRKGFIIAGFLTASTEIIGALSNSQDVALFFAIFSLSGLGLITANYWALTQTLLPGAAVGRLVGVQNFAANVPGIVAGSLTGYLLKWTGSYDAPMWAICIFLMTGIASYVFLVREQYVPKG
jgi:MFS transporter, ACS family, D-galactonate transporter